MTVDEALQEADEARSGLHIISPTASLVTLAAEVRRLRRVVEVLEHALSGE